MGTAVGANDSGSAAYSLRVDRQRAERRARAKRPQKAAPLEHSVVVQMQWLGVPLSQRAGGCGHGSGRKLCAARAACRRLRARQWGQARADLQRTHYDGRRGGCNGGVGREGGSGGSRGGDGANGGGDLAGSGAGSLSSEDGGSGGVKGGGCGGGEGQRRRRHRRRRRRREGRRRRRPFRRSQASCLMRAVNVTRSAWFRYAKCIVPLREVHGSLREVHTHVPLAPAHRCGARSLLAARWATSDKKSRATPFTPNLHPP